MVVASAAMTVAALAHGSGASGERLRGRRWSSWIWDRGDPRWRACAAGGLRGAASSSAASLLRTCCLRSAAMVARLGMITARGVIRASTRKQDVGPDGQAYFCR
jgi:hypothetical protein